MRASGERDINLSSPATYTIKIPSKYPFIALTGDFVQSTNLHDWSISNESLRLQQLSIGTIIVRNLTSIKEKLSINIYYLDNLILTLLFQ